MYFRLGVASVALAITLMAPLGFVSAATIPSFSLSLNPQSPVPYGRVVVNPQSTVLDLSVSTMTVSVNGKQTYQGNVQPFSATTGAPGSPTVIKVTMTSRGVSYTQSISINAGDVALIEEPRATVPVLYPGKPFVPSSGSVRIVAAADFRTTTGTHINPDLLSYTWTMDDAIVQSSSGIGRNSIVVDVPMQYRNREVSVVVKTQDSTQVGGGAVTIVGNEPSVRIYENDPLLGIRFDHALSGTYPIAGSEMSLFGVPYSFSLDGGLPTLSWTLNGASAQSGNALTLRPQGAGEGSASLSFTANKQSTYENAVANLSLTFGKSGGGLFGL